MTVKDKTQLRWIAAPWFVVWIWGFLDMHGHLWRGAWLCLAVIYMGAFWLLSKGSDIDTEAGLRRVSNVMVGFIVVEIAVVFFIAFKNGF
ncbi:MAG TPA: hypothetical protein VK829_03535 [Terriglobales bacterium]|jgi:hypothetical protein|nr:hypothetical protein [Terriglobales bacterium]